MLGWFWHQLVVKSPPVVSKMKSIILVIVALVAIAAAAPSERVEPPKIVRSEFVQQPDGSYVFNFETEDGVVREETGEVKEARDEENNIHKVVVVRGFYTFLNADGKPQTITYFADETGYHAEGDAIPKIVSRR